MLSRLSQIKYLLYQLVSIVPNRYGVRLALPLVNCFQLRMRVSSNLMSISEAGKMSHTFRHSSPGEVFNLIAPQRIPEQPTFGLFGRDPCPGKTHHLIFQFSNVSQ